MPDVYDIVNKFKAIYKSERIDPEDFYKAAFRRDELLAIAEQMKAAGIDYDEAKLAKKPLELVFVSEAGRTLKMWFTDESGQRRSRPLLPQKKQQYRNWVADYRTDFDTIFANVFVELQEIEEVGGGGQKSYGENSFILKKDDSIVSWVRENFGEHPMLLSQAHDINSTWFYKYLEDIRK